MQDKVKGEQERGAIAVLRAAAGGLVALAEDGMKKRSHPQDADLTNLAVAALLTGIADEMVEGRAVAEIVARAPKPSRVYTAMQLRAMVGDTITEGRAMQDGKKH